MSYVRNAWYVAGWSPELEIGKPFAMSILNDRIVIWKTESGALHALEDRCVHRLAPLSLGRCEGERLRCLYHGMLFDSGGKVVEIPGQELIPQNARVRAYPVAERHSWIWVWMGDPAQADEGLIPPAVGLEDPNYILGFGHLDYEAEARLINDNLLDFSHLTYVHADSFGAPPDFAESQARITPIGRGIRYDRWLENSHGSTARRSDDLLDNHMSYEFLLPGVLLMISGSFPAGTAKACDFGMPDYDEAVGGVTFTSQAVTPMTDKTSRYYFSWGPHVKHGNAEMRDGLMALADKAFAEDKVMIEAQQRVIDETVRPTIMPSAHDRGVTLFNRLVEKLARQEGETASRAA